MDTFIGFNTDMQMSKISKIHVYRFVMDMNNCVNNIFLHVSKQIIIFPHIV